MNTIDKGWEYISAIFQLLSSQMEDESIIAPQFIFRGVTKRFISRSKKIEDILYKTEREKENVSPEEIKKETEKKYEKFYQEVLSKWNNDYSKMTDSADALNKLYHEVENEKKPIAPECIKSGAAVRLQEVYGTHSHHVDYVNYIKHMLNDVKNRFPKYVDENYSDIEILADLQHKGAASCLVDFSNNFLTSLWFATETHFKDIGYLFCYDINKVTIEEDKLSILDESKSSKSIVDLLYETTKITRYSGTQSYKFWLWKPSNLNERIARQDSVFVFGLEAFKIEDHKIIVIPIPPTWKEPIQRFLKSFFGITGESIYCDVDGYADANSKLKPYDKITLRYFKEEQGGYTSLTENIQSGTDCLLQSEYELALKYFTLHESFVKENIEEIRDISNICLKDLLKKLDDITLKIELHYSKAVCLKHLQDSIGAINEYNVAWGYYEKVRDICNMDDTQHEKEEGVSRLKKYQKYIKNKSQKIINGLMDMYYDTRQYDEIIRMVKILAEPKDKNERSNVLTLKSTMIREAFCLKAMEEFISYNKEKKTQKKKKLIKLPTYMDKSNQPYYHVLNLYFDCIIDILYSKKYDSSKDSYKKLENGIIDKKKNQDEYNNSSFYSKWNFTDIEYYLEKIEKIDKKKFTCLKDITARTKDFENFVQGKVHIEAW